MSRWHEQRAKTWQERFWENVQKGEGDSCWIWTGPRPKGTYGNISVNDKSEGSHRASWMVHHGEIPAGQQVLHNCPTGDNPSCVNPAHLFLGTQTENIADMVAKGRQARGERSGNASLTEEAVTDIRRRHLAGEPLATIATDHGVNETTVTNVARGVRWGHVAGAVTAKRNVKGERHHAARLNADLVRQIRRRAAAGENLTHLARELGVSNGAVDHVVARRSWRHVPEEDGTVLSQARAYRCSTCGLEGHSKRTCSRVEAA